MVGLCTPARVVTICSSLLYLEGKIYVEGTARSVGELSLKDTARLQWHVARTQSWASRALTALEHTSVKSKAYRNAYRTSFDG